MDPLGHSDNSRAILTPGRNCWRYEKADRLSFLVDADAYFAAFRSAVMEARRAVYIIGWDIDSRIDLLREEPDDGLPKKLGPFLNEVAKSKPDLEITILLWDFAMIIGMDREWLPIFKLDWQTPKNISLRLDDHHPLGASHHQKIVVIDDQLAFVGGIDLTKARWDTPAHDPDEELRQNPSGENYRPHHDVQLMVSGEAARSLGDLFRERWQDSGGSKLSRPGKDLPAPWPAGFESDTKNCRIAIARTLPAYRGRQESREVEQLYLDTIKRARKFIYIENQYLTAPEITRALAERLKEKEGPEVVIVLPAVTEGWLSQFIMDALKGRAIRELREADRHDRLGIYYPYRKELRGENTIKIHSKLIIVDDRFVQVGSTNLNNRSMGLDTECDLAMEAEEDDDLIEAIRAFRYKLLSEHLDSSRKDLQKLQENKGGSLLAMIEEFSGKNRCLIHLQEEISEMAEKWLENADIFDPEHPIDPDNFLEKIAPEGKSGKGQFSLTGIVVIFFIILALAAAWRFTPLKELLNQEKLFVLTGKLADNPLAALYVVLVYMIGGVLVAPITGLIGLTAAIFEPLPALGYAIIGTGANATLTYILGVISGRNFVRRIAGDRINNISRKMAKQGVLSTVIIRLMPIAPFTVINMIAGASHIRFRDYIMGTIIGMLPGMLAIIGLIDRGTAIFQNPGPVTYLSLAAVILVVGSGFYFLRRRFGDELQKKLFQK